MYITRISNYSDFRSLKEDWNNLLRKSDNHSIFLTHEWFDCWWKTHGESYEENQNLFILVLKDKEEIIGIIPLKTSQITYRRMKVRKLGFLESGLSPFVDLILLSRKQECIEEIYTYLRKQKVWDILILNKISTKSPNYNLLIKSLKKEKMLFGIKPSLNTPVINTCGDWDDFLSQRSARFRKSIRYNLNKAKRDSSLQIKQFSEPDDIRKILPFVYEISRNSWKAEKKQSISDIPEYKHFFRYFIDEVADIGWINLWMLKSNDRYIAYEYHLKYDGIVYPIGADFDNRYRKLSPGSILEYNIIKALFKDNGVRKYYTCAQNYKYLQNWTDIMEPHVDIEVFNSGILSIFLYFVEYRFLPYLRRKPVFQRTRYFLKFFGAKGKKNV